MSILDPTAVVTWGEVGALAGVIGMVVTACGGFVMRQVSNLGKRLDDHAKRVQDQRDLIEQNHREVLRYYATQDMVTTVETRLSATIAQLSTDIRQMTGSFQQMLAEFMHRKHED